MSLFKIKIFGITIFAIERSLDISSWDKKPSDFVVEEEGGDLGIDSENSTPNDTETHYFVPGHRRRNGQVVRGHFRKKRLSRKAYWEAKYGNTI